MTVSEADAARTVRAEARRLFLLGGAGLLVAMLIYLAVSILLLDRPPTEAATRMLPLLAVVAVFAYFVQLPGWVRQRGAVVTAATVRAVGEEEMILGDGPGDEVSMVIPRGTVGFRRGDRVWVSPGLRPGRVVAVVVPEHVSASRPVISGRALPARR